MLWHSLIDRFMNRRKKWVGGIVNHAERSRDALFAALGFSTGGFQPDKMTELYPVIDIGNSVAQNQESEYKDGNESEPVLYDTL